IFGQIGRRHGSAKVIRRLQDALGNGTSIKRICAVAGDERQRVRKQRVAEHLAHYRSDTVSREYLGACFVRQQVSSAMPPVILDPLGDRISFARIVNRRLEDICPWQTSEPLM